MTSQTTAPRAGRVEPARAAAAVTAVRNRAALAVLSAAQFLLALDYSIVYVALPSIAADLRLEPAAAQWVVSAYAVLFAGFLMVGGRLVDRIGPRPIFLTAMTVFGAASAIGGLTADGPTLLAARGAQGLGAALLQPAVLGLIGTIFPAGQARSRALAVWGAVGASGLAAGVILGGLLTTVSWRFTFLINVPFVLLCVLGALRWFTRAHHAAAAPRVPAVGSVLGTGAVLAFVVALTLAAAQGWRADPVVFALGLALLLFLAFLRHEHRSRSVLVDRALRRIPSLRLGAAAAALYMASVGSEFYLVTLLLQAARDYPALRAGVAFLPLAVTVTLGSMAAGRAMRQVDPTAVLVAGFTIAAFGLGWLALAAGGRSYLAHLLPGLVISGLGHGIIYPSMFVLGTRQVPAEHQGTAGALLTTSQYLSAAVTVAVLTIVLGRSPDNGGFPIAFLLTAAAAVAGAGLTAAWSRRL